MISKFNIGFTHSKEKKIHGNTGHIHSEKHKKKISDALKGKKRIGTNKGIKNPMFGKKHSAESLEKMRLIKTGKKHTKNSKLKMSKNRIGNKNNNWNGGERITSSGYMEIYCPNHPNTSARRCVLKHRLVMEKHLNRYLTKLEVVHHIDGNKLNNIISNLMLFPNNSSHRKFHCNFKRSVQK